MTAQGWYHDPSARHEARWFSAGQATSLVRDGDVESHDEPPPGVETGELVAVEDQSVVFDDLARVEDPPEHRNVADGAGALGLGFD